MNQSERIGSRKWIGFGASSLRITLIAFLLAFGLALANDGVVVQAAVATGTLPLDADGPSVVSVRFESTEQLNDLAAELDIWEVDHERGSFVALVDSGQYEDLLDAGLTVTLLPAQTAEVRHAPVRAQWLRSADAGQQSEGGIPFYSCYRTVEETYADLADLAADNPMLARWEDVGNTWDKETPGGPSGYDINALVLTNRAIPGPKPRLAMIAAIHAREYTTAELATRFAEHLVAQYGIDADITWLLDYTELHLIPIANPDGRKWAESGYSWRKNTHDSMTCGYPGEVGLNVNEGVDLNRNSSFKWNGCLTPGCSSDYACYITYRGTAPASEPETQTIENYVRSIFPDRRCEEDTDAAPSDNEGLFISLHSYSELILYPWGWSNDSSPNGNGLQTLGRKFGYYTGYEVCQLGDGACLYLADGTTDDWSYGELGVASYTFELGTAFFQTCEVFENDILDRGIDALTYAMKASRRPYETPSGPEVLDVRTSVADGPTPMEIMQEGETSVLTITAGTPITLTAVADDARSASNGHGIEPAQAITAARYTVDVPSWITGTVTHSMTVLGHDVADDEAITAPTTSMSIHAIVDTTGWAQGQHLLLLEAQDAGGQWGVPTAIAVQVEDPNANSLHVGAALSQTRRQSAASRTLPTWNSLLKGQVRPYSQEPLECKSPEISLDQQIFLPAITNGVDQK